MALRKWIEEHKEYGKCYSRTRMLGYPSRADLTQWVMELEPQPRKFKRNGINLTSEKKKLLFLLYSLVIHLRKKL